MSNDNLPQEQLSYYNPSDIERFYYKKSSTGSKRSSLSLDIVLVALLVAKFGSKQKLRKWVSAQAKLAQKNAIDSKSISRMVQENAIRIIADPVLIEKMQQDQLAEAEKQNMMVPWLGQGNAVSSPKTKRL